MLIDSHCHLDSFEPAEQQDLIRRAHEAGVAELVTIGTGMEQSRSLRSLAARFGIWCTVGVHPNSVADAPVATADEVAALTDHPNVVGIGESGLDYFYTTAPRDLQQTSFRQHIRAAQSTGLPLVIHARDADDDIARLLQEETGRGGAFPFLLHCFSSGRVLAETAVAMGGYVSFSGILTFPKSSENRDIARDLPADRIMVETDAPYLAPKPNRGKRNEPAWVRHTAEALAAVRGLTPAELADLTTANFRRLFPRTA